MADSINIIVPKKATDSIVKLNNLIIALDVSYSKLLNKIESGQTMLKGQETSFKNVSKHQANTKKITQQLTAAERERIKVQKEQKAVLGKIIVGREKSNKVLQKGKIRLQEETRETKLSIIANKALSGSYEKISTDLSKNIIKWKKLSQEERNNTKAGKQLTQTIKKQEASLVKLDSQLGRSGRRVGSYRSQILSAGKSLLMVFGVGGGLFMGVRAIGNIIKKFTLFEHGMSKVKAVSGASNVEFMKLRNEAQRLGESTEKTASEVAGLEVALSKLGFSAKDILLATSAILDLSTAADADLAQSATVAAATLKGFGLQANEMTRVTDVMALSFSSSALDLEKFTNSMSKIAPVAKNANVSLEQSTAYLSLLVDRGLEASIAGTSLRNIFLELSKQGLSWNEAMEMINNATDKNNIALKLFGKRGATAAIILAENQKEAAKLTKEYEGAAGSAKKMADVMRDNLKGDTDKAKSALEGLAINLGEKLAPTLRKVTRGFTAFIGFLNKGSKSFSELNKYNSDLSKSINITTGELEKNSDELNTLVTRYEDLKKIVKPNKTQQEELETVMKNIVKIVPDAATEINEYGKVLKINTGFAKGFVKEQKEILGELATMTMPDIVSDLAETTKEVNKLENELRIGRETTFGTFEKLTKVEQIQNELSIKNLENRKDLTLEILNTSGIEENKIVNAFADEFSKSEVNLRNNIINTIRNFYVKKRVESRNAEDAELKELERLKVEAAKAAADKRLEEEKEIQIKIFALKKKYGLLTKKELADEEIKKLNATLLREEDKLKAIEIIYQKYFGSKFKIIFKDFNDDMVSDIDEALADIDEELSADFKNFLSYQKAKEAATKERLQQELEYEKSLNQAKWDLAFQTNEAIFDIISSRLEAQMQKNESARENELERAGEDAELKDKINTKYDKKQAELKTKQAKADKAAALFAASINIAMSITKSLAQFPLPLGLPMLLMTSAMGALQLAMIAARPIPKYKQGTKGKYDTEDTFVTSEPGAGTEWIENAGKIIMTTEPTIHRNSKGSRVYKDGEFEKILNNKQVGFDSREIVNALSDNSRVITRAIKNQKQLIIENGKVTGYRQSNYTRKYIERMTE